MDTTTMGAISARLDTADASGQCPHGAFPEVTEDGDAMGLVDVLLAHLAGAYFTGVMAGTLPELDGETLAVVQANIEHALIVAMALGMTSGALSSLAPDTAEGIVEGL